MSQRSTADRLHRLRDALAGEDRDDIIKWLAGDEEHLAELLDGGEFPEEQLIKQFLLGDLQGEDRERFETRLTTEEKLLAQLHFVEDQLIDDYLTDALSPADEEKFERYFLSEPERRGKLNYISMLRASARELVAEELKETIVGEEESASLSGKVNEDLSSYIENPVLRQKESVSEEEKKQTIPESSAWRSETDKPNYGSKPSGAKHKFVEWWRSVRESLQFQNLAVLTLVPGQVRGGASESGDVKIDSSVQGVQIKILLLEDSHIRYRIELHTVEGHEVWVEEDLSAQQTDAGVAVVVTLPPGLIGKGDYKVTLSGAAEDGNYEKIGTYYRSVSS